MKLSELPEHLKEVLAMQDILIGIGYSQDILSIFPCDEGIGVLVFLGGIHHKLLATNTKVSDVDEFVAQMTTATKTWNSASQEEREDLVANSKNRRNAVMIIACLNASGILPDQPLDFDCPFCGKHVRANTSDFSVSHAMPICERFDTSDPISFLRDARHKENSHLK
jgi:hypothetical protein